MNINLQHKKLQNDSCKATLHFVTLDATMTSSEKKSEEIQEEFGQWLKLQRRSADLTQQELADKVPMDRVHLARIEKGSSGSKRDTVIAIVETINKKSKTSHKANLDEALDRFYGRWQEYAGKSDDELVANGLFDGYYELPEEKRKIARAVIASTIRSLQEEDE